MNLNHFSTIREEADIDECYPNPWNPNEQTPFQFEKLKENIKVYGFNDPVLVTFRKNKKGEGQYIIIDGEHRWRGAKELGYTRVPIERMINKDGLSMDDFDIQFLTIQMNKGGEDNTVKRGKILKALMKHDPEALKNLSLFPEQIDQEIAAINFDMDQYSNRKPKLDTEVGISFKIPAEDTDFVNEVLDNVNENHNEAFLKLIQQEASLSGIKRHAKKNR